jgi:hypothetical protein
MAKSKKIQNTAKVISTEKVNTKITKEIIAKLPNFPIYIPIVLFIITTIIFFGPQLFGTAFFWEDFVEYIYPTQTFAAREFANGTIPHWNPYAFGGMPFMADLQVGFFYPFNRLLNFFMDANGNVSIWFLQFIAILHFFFAQLNYYLFAKYLKISSLGAILGAIAYSFAFPLVLHVIHPMIVFHLAWFPLIFLFFKKSLDTGSIRSGAIAGLIFGFTMLSGHPQITLYFAFIFGVYFVWHFTTNLMQKEAEVKFNPKAFIGGIAMFVIAVGIFMIQFMPSNEMAKHSARAVTSYEKSAENSLQFKQVWTLLLPKVLGHYEADSQTDYPMFLTDIYDGKESQVHNNYYWETALYFSFLPFLFGLFGIFTIKKDSFKWFLISVIIFGFLYALGKNFPLHKIFSYLPFFGTFRNPVRMFTFSMFGISLFSGFAFDAIANNIRNKKYLANFFIVFGIAFLFVIFSQVGILQSLLSVPEQYAGFSSDLTTSIFVLLIFSIIIGFLYIQNYIKPLLAGILFAVIIFMDLYFQGASFTQSKNDIQRQFEINPELKSLLKSEPPSSVYRVKTRMYSPSYMALKRNQGVIDNILMLEGYNPLMLNLAQVPLNWNELFEVMNVKYDLRIDSTQRGVEFYETANPLGPAYFVQKARFVPFENAKEIMLNTKIDYSNEVLIHSDKIDLNKYNKIDSNFSGKLKILEYKPNLIRYNVNVSKPCIMVFSEIYYPAWAAEIDGKEIKILQVNNSFRAIELPAGKHEVMMYYSDSEFAVGEIISIFSIVVAVTLIFAFRKK